MAFEDPGTFECNRRSGDLRAGWRAEAEAQGFDAAAFRGVFGRSAPTVATAEADERLAEELSSPTGLTRRASTFDRRAVLQALCEHLPTGGAFAGLARRLGAHTLRANRRQAEAWERAALASLRAGQVSDALDAYLAHDRVVSAPTADQAREMLVADWWAAGLKVRNGTVGTVSHVDPAMGTITLNDDPGARITLLAEYLNAGHLTHAYATTVHKAQGTTADRALLLGNDDLYLELGYVKLSRGRAANHLYVVGVEPNDNDERGGRHTSERDPYDEMVPTRWRS